MVSGARILLVEDEANARIALSELLTDAGYLVATAVDGLEALSVNAAFHPDVVVTDVRMPRMDGFQLAEALREDTLSPSLPVVMMSATEPLGGSIFVPKPIQVDKLLSVIKRALVAGAKARAGSSPSLAAAALHESSVPVRGTFEVTFELAQWETEGGAMNADAQS